MSEKKLVMKLVEVMKQVKYIQKTGRNAFHKYNYATEADVNEKVREVLAEQGVMLIPNVKSQSYREHINKNGNTEYIVTVEVEFTFIDGETGETLSFTTFGEGQDAGDKGTYKAITGAQKYALMKAFMIPTGDDPESDSGVDERNSNNTNRQKAETEKRCAPASLTAKYQLWIGSMDKFDEWYTAQQAKFNDIQIERFLTTQLQKKQGA